MVYQPPRGMDDIGPEEMQLREFMSGGIKAVFKKYGFKLVEPSMVEEFRTLAAKAGAAIKDEIYYFKDKGGRELGLRFDLTVGASRMVAANPNWPKPVKLASLSPMWRYDRPGYGRKRWFWQWNIEVFGVEGPEADAEAIACSIDILEAIGIKDFEARVGNRKVVEEILGELKIKNIEGALRTIDKIQKLKRSEVLAEFKKCGIGLKEAEEIIKAVSLKGTPEEVLPKIKDCEGKEELRQVFGLLKLMNKEAVIDLSVVRGIGYYTGLVWEAYETGKENIGSLFGGGRYDSLVKVYSGRDMAATGCAGGIEREIMALDKAKAAEGGKRILVVSADDDSYARTIEVCTLLRNAGKSAMYDLLKRKLSKNLDYANSEGIEYIVIIGQRDLKEGKATIRNMKSGKEEQVPVEKIRDCF